MDKTKMKVNYNIFKRLPIKNHNENIKSKIRIFNKNKNKKVL